MRRFIAGFLALILILPARQAFGGPSPAHALRPETDRSGLEEALTPKPAAGPATDRRRAGLEEPVRFSGRTMTQVATILGDYPQALLTVSLPPRNRNDRRDVFREMAPSPEAAAERFLRKIPRALREQAESFSYDVEIALPANETQPARIRITAYRPFPRREPTQVFRGLSWEQLSFLLNEFHPYPIRVVRPWDIREDLDQRVLETPADVNPISSVRTAVRELLSERELAPDSGEVGYTLGIFENPSGDAPSPVAAEIRLWVPEFPSVPDSAGLEETGENRREFLIRLIPRLSAIQNAVGALAGEFARSSLLVGAGQPVLRAHSKAFRGLASAVLGTRRERGVLTETAQFGRLAYMTLGVWAEDHPDAARRMQDREAIRLTRWIELGGMVHDQGHAISKQLRDPKTVPELVSSIRSLWLSEQPHSHIGSEADAQILTRLPDDELVAGLAHAIEEELSDFQDLMDEAIASTKHVLADLSGGMKAASILQQRSSPAEGHSDSPGGNESPDVLLRKNAFSELLQGIQVVGSEKSNRSVAIVLSNQAASAILLLNRLPPEQWPLLFAITDTNAARERLLSIDPVQADLLRQRIVTVEEAGSRQEAWKAVEERLTNSGFSGGPLDMISFSDLSGGFFQAFLRSLKAVGIFVSV